MLIDFCHYSVQPKIKTDKVSFDGYEIENLISNDPEKKRKGFLSDHFIKPPVNLTVQFPCNICISRIVIDPVIGQQKSCELKIFTACEKMTDSWLYNKNSKKTVTSDGVIFNFVGTVSMVEPSVVCFVNNNFKERNFWRTENDCIVDLNSYPCVKQLSSKRPGGLNNTSHVTICINRTYSGKAVAVKRLEIWGIPSIRVPHPVQMTLKNTYTAAIQKNQVAHKMIPNKANTSISPAEAVEHGSTQSESRNHSIEGVTIPDDFIDQITFEIMTVPVVLPCGKVIDRSTLDRFVNSEASWGRQPSDPFTGVVFSQGKVPVTNASLKTRIDQFMLMHSGTLKVSQTLGHSDPYKSTGDFVVSSKLVPELSDSNMLPTSQPLQSKRSDESVSGIASETQPWNARVEDQFSTERNALSLSRNLSSVDMGKRKQQDSQLSHSSENCKKIKVIDLTETKQSHKELSKVVHKPKQVDHNRDLSKSLDSALLSTLGNLPSFMKKPSNQSENSLDSNNKCSVCQIDLKGSESSKYKMPCKHLICRSCLVKTGVSFVCSICSRMCNSSQVVRVF